MLICHFVDTDQNNVQYTGEQKIRGVEETIGKIMEFTGLPQNFQLEEVSWGNAAAFIEYSTRGSINRKICYKPDFFLKLNDSTGNYWASISILAHEIGHHLAGHTEVTEADYTFELEADKFSGFILNRMGATNEDAKTAVETVLKNKITKVKGLGREERLDAIINGWAQSEKSRHVTLTVPGLYPQASVGNLNESELENMKVWDLRIMKNEIYARHGYKFHSLPELHNYFNMTAWYHLIPPVNEDPDIIYRTRLTNVEKRNILKIAEIIKDKSERN